MRPVTLAAILTCAVLAQQSSGWPNATASFQIHWAPCSNSSLVPECGQLQVPLDWARPNGTQISLGIQRVKATNSTVRKGSLFYNPGGPGVAATTLCSAASIAFGHDLLRHYDLICPDPRGVGTSTRIKCEPAVWNRNVSISPKNDSQFLEMVNWSRQRGVSCLNMTGDLLRHVDTRSTAMDFEAIRLALNDGKLNLLAQSYGSRLGATYAELFPQNVGSFVFDGVENHALDPATTLFVKSTTFENELNRFFDWCAANTTRCGFHADDVAKSWKDLIVNATRSPIPASSCTGNSSRCKATVSGDEIILNAQNLLTWQNTTLGILQGWSTLGQALNATITRNDASGLSNTLASSSTDAAFAGAAIECLDWKRFANASANSSTAYATFRELHAMGTAFNPAVSIYSDAYSREALCVGWPINPVDPQHALNHKAMARLPPILLVNSNHDPFTGYAWAVGAKSQIPKSVLVTREGDGHTSYFLKGNASMLIDAFLVNGTLPKDGTIVFS